MSGQSGQQPGATPGTDISLLGEEHIRVYRETNDLKAVVDRLIDLTSENVPRNANLVAVNPSLAPSAIAK